MNLEVPITIVFWSILFRILLGLPNVDGTVWG